MLQQVYGDDTILHIYVFEWHKKFKERLKEVKDNSMNWRPLTSKIEVNGKQVYRVVWGDCWLIVQIIASQQDMKKKCLEDLVMSEK